MSSGAKRSADDPPPAATDAAPATKPKAKLKARGETVMTILSDPYAEAAYIHMGAKRVAMRPSDVFKGRELPWLEVVL